MLKVLNIAYHISSEVREYLSSVDRDRVPEIISLDNPRVFPIVYRSLYAEDRLHIIDKQNLVFRFNDSGRSSFDIPNHQRVTTR